MQRGDARRSPRLVGYDYNQPGLYFVTMCTYGREPTLGEAEVGAIRLSSAGVVVQLTWEQLPDRFPGLELDAFVIMPNHIHGVVTLGSGPDMPSVEPPSLNQVIRAFKSISGIAGNAALGRIGQPFWQRSYHDRIIRNERELALIRAYIADNPTCWEMDINNPAAGRRP